MAARTVALTDTLETFRTTFNSLSQTDIGDPSTLTTTATNLVGAINEVATSHYSGFTISDSASSVTQSIGGGDNITFAGDSNITIAISDQDTVSVRIAGGRMPFPALSHSSNSFHAHLLPGKLPVYTMRRQLIITKTIRRRAPMIPILKQPNVM